jgi:hypothetical protein
MAAVMGKVVQLFDKEAVYTGTCLDCGKVWIVTKEQLDVALECGILYSGCCEQPATIAKAKSHVKKTDQSPPHL